MNLRLYCEKHVKARHKILAYYFKTSRTVNTFSMFWVRRGSGDGVGVLPMPPMPMSYVCPGVLIYYFLLSSKSPGCREYLKQLTVVKFILDAHLLSYSRHTPVMLHWSWNNQQHGSNKAREPATAPLILTLIHTCFFFSPVYYNLVLVVEQYYVFLYCSSWLLTTKYIIQLYLVLYCYLEIIWMSIQL